MTSLNKRGSLNTSLKNARIFDDDSWDATQLKNEEEPWIEKPIKKETLSPAFKIKSEPEDSNSPFNKKLFENFNIKQESISPFTTPIKTEIKTEPKEEAIEACTSQDDSENANDTELFEQCSGPRRSPRKSIRDRLGPPVDTRENKARKSAKRTVFERESPYKRNEGNATKSYLKEKPQINKRPELMEVQAKKPKKSVNLESDVEVLKRRQKQIDFGKNTLGYEAYLEMVPRGSRSSEDPQTPNKNVKYSRRAWDGLIKQWRVRLHKYDPADNE
ncbi:unnamed protein product [Brassicogethes aeneus]|uniref:Histone RNA hairpin-binding protein RNA-binding domain-containing protein n=1 Tax=Brassicogethes aeneus TaxID=1431903 RepID=A0A9P0B7B9_BRAAE|nr:unnamed protein product [Brassicogethes aeneus]